jgi:hypothetical protein
MLPPPHLYKYESLTMQTLQNLKGQILYFGSPLKFNDPYDCALKPNIRPPTDDEVEEHRRRYLQSPSTPPLIREEIKTSPVRDLRETLLRGWRSAVEEATRNFLATHGVACFSERNDDLLMWSHYGGRYKGLCLEFSTTSEAFAKVLPVRYEETLPTLDPPSVPPGVNSDQYATLLCTKSKAWSYEREWRVVHNQADTEYRYSAESLTGVYFGPEIDRRWLEIVCLVLLGQNESVKFWRGTRSTAEFKILFEQFTYTPYIEARRASRPAASSHSP